MKYQITINDGNAAFEDPGREVARILDKLSKDIQDNGLTDTHLYDINGNRVGIARRIAQPIKIIIPLPHGGGGWYGSCVVRCFASVEEALNTLPEEFDWTPYYDPSYGITNAPRICASDDPNDDLYVWDEENYRWAM